ncbi:MAG: hypothetical protein WCP69_01650 [Bacteroidota bacterium]
MVRKVNFDAPTNANIWNNLCLLNGNLLQSTYYDSVQDFYRQEPVYIEYYEKGELIAGAKLYHWYSKKLKIIIPKISNSYTQFGEFLVHPDWIIDEIILEINNGIRAFLISEKAVSYRASGFYGNLNLISSFSNKAKSNVTYNVAYLDLTQSEEVMLKEMHVKHRNVLNKAIKCQLSFSESTDVNVLIDMIAITYSGQKKDAPNSDYIKKLFHCAIKNNFGKLYVVKNNEEILSVAFVQFFGVVADYTFGGNKKNSLGAGQFLQWNIIKSLKNIGIQKYSLGQVAKELDAENLKFSEGISKYKMRFGCNTIEAKSVSYIFKPISYKLFSLMLKLIVH